MKKGSGFNPDGFFQPISMPDGRVVTSAFSYSSARGQFEPFKAADVCDCSEEDVKHTYNNTRGGPPRRGRGADYPIGP